MEDDRVRLEKNFAKTLQGLSGLLTSVPIRNLTKLYTKISNREAEIIRKDDDPADCLFQKLKDMKELDPTNVDGLIENLQCIESIDAADVLESFKTRNKNLIKKEIERRKQEKQPVASSASSTAKSPPSQKGDRTEEQSVASTASSVPVKSPPSQKGDRTDIKNKIFISFSSKNLQMATDLVGEFESELGKGICWIYMEEIKTGESLNETITDAIEHAHVMACVITQDYIDSEPCENEFLLAKRLKKQIILLHMEKISQPYKKTNGHNSRIQMDVTDQVYARMYDNPKEQFQKVIDKIKECLPGKDANASGETLVAPGSQKRKSSQDGDASEVKVTRKE